MNLLAIVMIAITSQPTPQATTREASPVTRDLRAMSFNIRLGSADDGPNHWRLRRELLFQRVEAFSPDLLGAQEVLSSQTDELLERFPEYGFIGVGRDDGKRAGEFSPILFRKSRFEHVNSGTTWLSETPDAIGSKGWDAALPRIATWAVLRDRAADVEVVVINTHFDHIGQRARLESAKLLRKKAFEISRGGSMPVIVMGDFNCTEDDPPYALLVEASNELKLDDAYRRAYPSRSADEATFHAFKGDVRGSRIDFVFSSPDVQPLASEIDRASDAGRFPSDHFPVTCVLHYARHDTR